MLDYNFTSTSPKINLLRLIAQDSEGAKNSPVYIFPNHLKSLGISLEVIYLTLFDLQSRNLIEILMRPNPNSTELRRSNKDDEEDYYFIEVSEGFTDYLAEVEATLALYENSPSATDSERGVTSADEKVKYDKITNELYKGETRLYIRGSISPLVCKYVFKNRKQAVYCDEIREEIDRTKPDRIVYDAVIRINEKIEEAFNLSNFLMYENGKVWISKKYL